MTNPVICEHGSYYAGECYRCEIARLTARIAELETERDRLRVECEAWRSESLYCCGGLVGLNGRGPLTIEEAVNALMAEREVK